MNITPLPLVFTGYRVFDSDTKRWLERVNHHHGKDQWTGDKSRARVYIHPGIAECIVTLKHMDMPAVFIEEVDCSYDAHGDICAIEHEVYMHEGYAVEHMA